MREKQPPSLSTKKRKAAPRKPNPKFIGRVCEICGVKYEPHPNTGKYRRFITHHLKYPSPEDPSEVTAAVCLSCHNWMSGNGMVFNHVLKPRNMTDKDRAEGPFWFAAAVVQLYEDKLIVPELVKELEAQKTAIAGAAIVVPAKKDTTH